MWRLTEGGLLAMPLALLAIFLVLRARGQEPTRRALLLGFAGLATLGGALAWFGTHSDLLPPGTHYVPAVLRDGEVVPGHGAEAPRAAPGAVSGAAPGTAAARKPRDGEAAGGAVGAATGAIAPGASPGGG